MVYIGQYLSFFSMERLESPYLRELQGQKFATTHQILDAMHDLRQRYPTILGQPKPNETIGEQAIELIHLYIGEIRSGISAIPRRDGDMIDWAYAALDSYAQTVSLAYRWQVANYDYAETMFTHDMVLLKDSIAHSSATKEQKKQLFTQLEILRPLCCYFYKIRFISDPYEQKNISG